MTGTIKREFEPVALAMHEMPYGVYVVGSVDEAGPNVMVADWVMQVSFEPRMVAVAFERDSSTLGRVRANGRLSVNLLPADDDSMRMAMGFVQPANPAKVEGRHAADGRVDKLAGVAHRIIEGGLPVIDDAVAWLRCEAEQFVEVGDHVLVLARVLEGDTGESAEPMTTLYTGWSYSG
jgi:3-hydroxy-9,10-secoandrosta-1,3,5(10)-triene-9,17-dione monooxygenase reductase component